MPPKIRDRIGRVDDLGRAGFGDDRARVADLATRLGVERGPIEEDLDDAVVGPVEHAQYTCLGPIVGVADELGRAELVDDLPVPTERGVVDGALGRSLRTGALGVHLDVEAVEVDVDRALGGDLLGQLQRESVGVVEQERRGSRQRAGVLLECRVEDRQPVLEGVPEALLLAGDHVGDEILVLDQIGIGGAHHADRRLGQLRHHERLGAEHVGEADRSADDSPQHVAATLVGREDPVVDEHRARTSMFGEDAEPEAVTILVVTDQVLLAGQRLGLVDQRLHQIGFPHRVDTLLQRKDPFEPGAGVDRRTWQRGPGAVRRLVELHEHQVPELHEPVTERVAEWAAVRAELGPAVDVQFAARTAGTRVAHLPEVVLVAEPLDPLHRHPDLLVPDRLGLVIGVVDGDPQPVAVESPSFGGEFPGPGDRLVLEVVAEAEVSEHLEEHEVALGPADIVEVVVLAARTGAFL